jgi:hypothetical protein
MSFISRNRILWIIVIVILVYYSYYCSQHLIKSQDSKRHNCQIFRLKSSNYVTLTYGDQIYSRKFHALEIFTDKNEIQCWTNLKSDIRLYLFKYDTKNYLNAYFTKIFGISAYCLCVLFL